MQLLFGFELWRRKAHTSILHICGLNCQVLGMIYFFVLCCRSCFLEKSLSGQKERGQGWILTPRSRSWLLSASAVHAYSWCCLQSFWCVYVCYQGWLVISSLVAGQGFGMRYHNGNIGMAPEYDLSLLLLSRAHWDGVVGEKESCLLAFDKNLLLCLCKEEQLFVFCLFIYPNVSFIIGNRTYLPASVYLCIMWRISSILQAGVQWSFYSHENFKPCWSNWPIYLT